MDSFITWFNRNKCTIYKVGLGVALTIILVGLFAGTVASGGAGTGLAGLLAANFGLSAGIATALAKIMLALVGFGVSMSGLGDWFVCKIFNIAECCHESVRFWIRYGEFVEANGGNGNINPDQCAELRAMLNSFEKIEQADRGAIEGFLDEHCDEE